MTLVGKINAYDYYRGLEDLTDSSRSLTFKNRYESFRRVIREWRHLKMLKRAGRGNDGVRSVDQTYPGELAITCPACPRVGVNLPDSWDQTDPKKRYIYRLFLAVDACFRLKRKLVSSEEQNPGFGTGWAYMVPDEPYRRYLLETTNEVEMSTCSGLAALDHANSRNSKGNYSSSGVGLGCCARHEFIQPNGVGDLQKGERYCNMDWIIACILGHHSSRLNKCLSYDIACQYCKHFLERIMKLPEEVRPKNISEFLFVIPKLHIYGHTLNCQLSYSLNYAVGVGRTDGEGVERNWAGQGPIATSTTEMGPGTRHDTLDDHWSHWNWQKFINLGPSLFKRLRLALEWEGKQREAYESHSVNQASQIKAWKKMVHDFEADSTKPNPYELSKTGLTLQQVRLELAQEELSKMPSVEAINSSATDRGPGAFMLLALEVEERQRQLREDIRLKQSGSTVKQVADIVDKRMRLRKLIARFQLQQDYFMPIVNSLRLTYPIATTNGVPEVEEQHLFLPSSLSSQQLSSCPAADLAEIECRLRNAQCSESLDELRNQLLIKSRLRTYKFGQARHQGRLRRSSHLLQQNELKIRLHSRRYQVAWEAIRLLRGGDPGRVPWRKLNASDIQCMEDPEDKAVGVLRKNWAKARAPGTSSPRLLGALMTYQIPLL
ncbi:hypothetical protein MPER_13087 [Moniliophthora perniciosa FA553]|nr:hypothetical protein MPER_13087 [Moniliophthora perniciosa FA553]